MNLALPTGPLVQAIGWGLLHLLWQGTLVAALLAVLLQILAGRSAGVRYVVSCVALSLIVVLGIASAARSYHVATAAAPAIQPASPAAPIAHPAKLSLVRLPAPDRLRAIAGSANRALPAIVAVWLAGVALFSIRLVLAWLRTRLLTTRHAERAREQWQLATRRLSEALGVRQAVRVLESARVEVPAVIGLLKPAILLPASILAGLSPAQLDMILAHELAHIRRHDFLVNLLQAVVETLLFYHPAVWWISRQVRIERENCCDDLAVSVCGNRLQYARALLRLEELRAAVPTLAVSANGGSLFARVRRIAVGSRLIQRRALRGTVALAMLPIVLAAIAVPLSPALGRSALAVRKSVRHLVPASFTTTVAGLPAVPVPIPVVVTAISPDPRTRAVAAAAEDDPPPATVAPQDDPDAEDAPEPEETPAPDAGKLSIDDLIGLRAMGVRPEDIREMRALFPRASLKAITGMKAVGVTSEFVRKMRDAGLQVRTAEDAQGLAAVGVTPRFIRAMRDAGLEVNSAQEAQGLAAVGVTPEFIGAMRDAGLEVNSAQEAQGLAAVGVTPEFIHDMRAAGLEIESAEEAQGLAAVGVTSKLIESLRAAGLDIESAREAQGLAAVGVTPEYVRGIREAGVEFTNAGELQSLRALGVTPRLVRRLAQAGYDGLTVEQLTRLAAGGVTGDFVREMSQYRK
ncbi:MAG TPA: M56 family metallopeptidase [Candidatus Eisenbacteria bacterium]|jgi:beta-lactamase regulating signal transducer with metallopeptidase domain